jgi:hypothetical protein
MEYDDAGNPLLADIKHNPDSRMTRRMNLYTKAGILAQPFIRFHIINENSNYPSIIIRWDDPKFISIGTESDLFKAFDIEYKDEERDYKVRIWGDNIRMTCDKKDVTISFSWYIGDGTVVWR